MNFSQILLFCKKKKRYTNSSTYDIFCNKINLVCSVNILRWVVFIVRLCKTIYRWLEGTMFLHLFYTKSGWLTISKLFTHCRNGFSLKSRHTMFMNTVKMNLIPLKNSMWPVVQLPEQIIALFWFVFIYLYTKLSVLPSMESIIT